MPRLRAEDTLRGHHGIRTFFFSHEELRDGASMPANWKPFAVSHRVVGGVCVLARQWRRGDPPADDGDVAPGDPAHEIRLGDLD